MKHPIQQVLESADYDARPYSGRGMLGRSCLGVDIDAGQLGRLFAAIIVNVADEDREEVARAVKSFHVDSLGMDQVVYFPDVEYVAPGEEG